MTIPWSVSREKALRRDKYTCQNCGLRANQVHHIIPRKHGGTDKLENLTSLCETCHQENHDFLRPEGYKPKTSGKTQKQMRALRKRELRQAVREMEV